MTAQYTINNLRWHVCLSKRLINLYHSNICEITEQLLAKQTKQKPIHPEKLVCLRVNLTLAGKFNRYISVSIYIEKLYILMFHIFGNLCHGCHLPSLYINSKVIFCGLSFSMYFSFLNKNMFKSLEKSRTVIRFIFFSLGFPIYF